MLWIDVSILVAVSICYVLYVIERWRSKRDVIELKDRVRELYHVQRAIKETLMDTSTTQDSN
jgi:hypothetical protein